MSILNGGSFVGSALGSGLTASLGVSATNFDNLALLVTICTLSSLAPLALLHIVPAGAPADQINHKAGYLDKD